MGGIGIVAGDAMDEIDCAVIGAGVVGLAVARELALAGREVVVLEANAGIGMETSSRNSEVIHAGVYYPTGSLKARLCVEGRERLYRYCAEHAVPHRKLGKLIVAVSDAEVETVQGYARQGAVNGVDDLVWLDRAQLGRMEPAVRGVAALFSPSSGILDGHAFMLALQGDAEYCGAQLALKSPVVGGEVRDDGILLRVGGVEETAVLCRAVVNAAGPHAQSVARAIRGIPNAAIPERHLAKGHYFALAGRSPFSHLVYPVAGGGGLGVHVTLDLSGQARFGPDVSWVDEIDYRFDEGRAAAFYAAIRRYWPELPDGALVPGYTGIRPKLVPEGAPATDFRIDGPQEHGVPGLVNLFGIESPGLTASLAIATHAAALLGERRPAPLE